MRSVRHMLFRKMVIGFLCALCMGITGCGASGEEAPRYLLPSGTTAFLSENDLPQHNFELTGFMMREILARHGYSFMAGSSYDVYFRDTGWYHPREDSDNVSVFAELSDAEWHNLELLKRLRAEQGGGKEGDMGTMNPVFASGRRQLQVIMDMETLPVASCSVPRRILVYSAPDPEALMPSGQPLWIDTNRTFDIAGIINGFAFVRFESADGKQHTGYVAAQDLGDQAAELPQLSFIYTNSSMGIENLLYDDPMNENLIAAVPCFTKATLLFFYGDGIETKIRAYIETRIDGQRVRGFLNGLVEPDYDDDRDIPSKEEAEALIAGRSPDAAPEPEAETAPEKETEPEVSVPEPAAETMPAETADLPASTPEPEKETAPAANPAPPDASPAPPDEAQKEETDPGTDPVQLYTEFLKQLAADPGLVSTEEIKDWKAETVNEEIRQLILKKGTGLISAVLCDTDQDGTPELIAVTAESVSENQVTFRTPEGSEHATIQYRADLYRIQGGEVRLADSRILSSLVYTFQDDCLLCQGIYVTLQREPEGTVSIGCGTHWFYENGYGGNYEYSESASWYRIRGDQMVQIREGDGSDTAETYLRNMLDSVRPISDSELESDLIRNLRANGNLVCSVYYSLENTELLDDWDGYYLMTDYSRLRERLDGGEPFTLTDVPQLPDFQQ